MKASRLFSFLILTFSLCGCATPGIQSTTIPSQASATPPPPAPTVDPNSWELVWADEFDQPDGSVPDPQKWNYQQGGAGWGNGEL